MVAGKKKEIKLAKEERPLECMEVTSKVCHEKRIARKEDKKKVKYFSKEKLTRVKKMDRIKDK